MTLGLKLWTLNIKKNSLHSTLKFPNAKFFLSSAKMSFDLMENGEDESCSSKGACQFSLPIKYQCSNIGTFTLGSHCENFRFCTAYCTDIPIVEPNLWYSYTTRHTIKVTSVSLMVGYAAEICKYEPPTQTGSGC